MTTNTATLDFNILAGGGAQLYSTTAVPGDPGIVLDLSATPNAQGYYTVIGASGMIDIGGTDYSVTGVSTVDGADNLFNPSGSANFVDQGGITLTTTDPNADGVASGGPATSTDINLFFQSSSLDYFIDATGAQAASSVTVSNVSVCFCSGTLIRTARGDVAVEDLNVGDLALTTGGEARPIVWIGHRKVTRPTQAQWPVRVAAGAFGESLPTRDLFLSAGHAVCVSVMDEAFVPVGELVNGATIVQVEVPEATYWHVELESHDVLLAESLPCESYMDAGNRAWFGHEYGRLAEIDPERVAESLARYARPFVSEGPVIQAVRERLAARADVLASKVRPTNNKAA